MVDTASQWSYALPNSSKADILFKVCNVLSKQCIECGSCQCVCMHVFVRDLKYVTVCLLGSEVCHCSL